MSIEDVFAVGAQEADALLIREQSQRPLREVEEGADAGVGLAVVVAEGAFIIAAQLRNTVVNAERPVMREGFADFEFDRFVFTLGIPVGVGLAVGDEFAAEISATGDRAFGTDGGTLGRIANGIRELIAAGVCPCVGVHGREAGAACDRATIGSVETLGLV